MIALLLEPFRQLWGFLKNYPVAATIILALIIRFPVVGTADFPLNDGGMFYAMTEEIKNSNFKIPLYTSYNNTLIPFTYPPLSFYLAAFISSGFSISPLSVFHFLPLVISLLTVPAFYLVAKDMLGKNKAILATFVFTLLPRSFVWFIMGGGIARASGLLFSLLGIHFTTKYFKDSKKTNLFFASALLALTLLTHLEWYFFAFFSLLIISFLFKNPLTLFRKTVLVTIFSLAATSFWWLIVIQKHGISPFSAFLKSGVSTTSNYVTTYFYLFTLRITDEPFLTIWGVLILLGAVICLIKRKYPFLVWFLIFLIIAPRSSPNLIVVPVSILITYSLAYAIIPAVFKNSQYHHELVSKLFLTFIFFYLIFSLTFLSFSQGEGSYFRFVTKQERETMEWIKQNTNEGDKFLLLTNDTLPSWGMDPVSEWFPVLAKRTSISTPQGTEWLPGNKFLEKVKLYTKIKGCYDKNLACIEDLLLADREDFTHIYLYKPFQGEKDTLPLIRHELLNSEKYTLIFENPKSTVFSKKLN